MQHTNIMLFLHYEKATKHNQESLMISLYFFLIISLDSLKINGHVNDCGEFTNQFAVSLLTLEITAIASFKTFLYC